MGDFGGNGECGLLGKLACRFVATTASPAALNFPRRPPPLPPEACDRCPGADTGRSAGLFPGDGEREADAGREPWEAIRCRVGAKPYFRAWNAGATIITWALR